MLHRQVLSTSATDDQKTTAADHRIIDFGIGSMRGGKG